MKQGFITLLLLTGFIVTSWAQSYDTVTIQEIQKVSQSELANCSDASPRQGDTVWVRGTVVMDGDVSAETDDNSSNVWIQNGSGPYSGLDIFDLSPDQTSGTKVENLKAGDSVLVRGSIEEFEGESEIVPQFIKLISSNQPINVTEQVTVADLNDGNQTNKLTTGEQWEGCYAQLTNLRIISVDFFSGDSRVSFIVQDDKGNQMNISDRFMVQRLPGNGGDFEAPPVGTFVDTLRGVIAHSKNGCPGTGGRGYELFPFKDGHYQYGAAPPIISDIEVSPEVPSASDNVSISAKIEELNTSVKQAYLHYAVGENATFDSLAMTNSSANTYQANVPTQPSDGSLVKYYISATDNDTPRLKNAVPNVPNGSAPAYYRVRNNGLSIYDLQYAPFAEEPYLEEASGYQGQEVTVTGVVTATAQSNGLGYIYMQQQGKKKWAGIQLTGNSKLTQAKRGARLRVTGTVEENFGFTRLANVSSVTQVGADNEVPVVNVKPGEFTSYNESGNEAYEGMLVNMAVPDQKLYIVDTNADYSPNNPQNFAEYRVGPDTTKPDSGSRVIAGRQASTASSSLNVSYVNSKEWELADGIMNIKPKVVEIGESLDSLRGIMYYSFSNMKLLPRNNDDFYNYSDPVQIDTTDDDSTSAVNRASRGKSIGVYPNPVTDQLTVNLNQAADNTYQVSVTDLKGRHVRSMKVNGAETLQLPVGSLKPGAYVVTVLDKDGALMKYEKVIIQE